MTDSQKHTVHTGINPVLAAAAGVAVGAAGVALLQKENRQKLAEATNKVKQAAEKIAIKLQNASDSLGDDTENMMEKL